MHDNRLAALAAKPPITTLDVVPQYIVLSSQHLDWNGIIVWRQQSPPLEMYLPPITQHSVLLQLNAGPYRMQTRDGGRHEGPWHRGDVVIYVAGQPSGWRAEGAVDNLHMDLEPRFLRHVALEACDMNPDQVELRDIFSARDPVIKSLGLALHTELTTDGLGGRLYAESLGNILALHLLRNYCVRRPHLRRYQGGLPKPKLRRALEYIDVHLAEPVALADLAGLVQMSAHHFRHLFKQSTGLAPHQYLIHRRIERAKALLTRPDLSIGEIALHIGFRTQSHFTWHFHRLTGLTATAYRNAQSPAGQPAPSEWGRWPSPSSKKSISR
jgi:AraC family transcriptional regulator